jgi:hypothetical protein
MRLPILAGLFLALAVTCAYSQQPSLSQKSPPSQKPPPNAAESQSRLQQIAPERGTEQAPFVIQLIPPPKAAAVAGNETEAQTKRSTDWSSVLLTIFNGLLVVCTALLFAIARSQRNDLRAIQRAYISAEPGGLHPLWGEKREEHWVIGHVKFRNGGRMPARNFRWYATIACDENPLREEFPIPSKSEFEGTTIIAPGSAMKFGTKEIELLPESGWIYVWGAYTYDDGFEADQFARFCHRYNRKALRKEMDKSDPDSGHGIPADDGRLHRFGNSRERPPTSRSEPSPPQTPSETS